MQDSQLQMKLPIVSPLLQCNEDNSSTSETSNSAIQILQKGRYQYHKLNDLQNMEMSNKSSAN